MTKRIAIAVLLFSAVFGAWLANEIHETRDLKDFSHHNAQAFQSLNQMVGLPADSDESIDRKD
jgi:hypothetical protein